jgi:hypothetical protein
MWSGTWLYLAWGAVLLVLAGLLVPYQGGIGLALAYALAYLVQLGLALGYVHWRLVPGLFGQLAGLARLSVLVLAASVWLVQWADGFNPWWRLLPLSLAGLPLARTLYLLVRRVFANQAKEPSP